MDHAGSLDEIKSEIDAPVLIHPLETERFHMMFHREHKFSAISDGDIITVKGHNVRALHMPGHTAGHLCFFDETAGILFSGDMIIGSDFAVIVPPDGDMSEYMRSLDRAKALPLKMILPGHGAPVHNPREKIEEYIHHRSMRQLQLIKLLEDVPRAIPDLAEEIYADLMPGLRLTGRLQIMAHLTDMEKAGLVEHVSGEGTDAVYRSLAEIA
jgi:glyoxylase-like metal-dependent hydrolase (beta-lactamase superfamily II)